MAKMASTIADVVVLLLLLSLADVAALSSTLRLRLDRLDARASRDAHFCFVSPARSALSCVERMWNISASATISTSALANEVRLVLLGRKISTQFRMQLECCLFGVDCAAAAYFIE